MTSGPTSELSRLPVEILRLIFSQLQGSALVSVSLVDRRFRALSTSHLFHTITVPFTSMGLDKLEKFSNSHLAQHAKVLLYEASELVDPFVRHWDYFTSCVYTPQEYARDQREFGWGLRDTEMSYASIHAYFSWLVDDQERILAHRNDTRIISESIQRLSGLRTIKLSITETSQTKLLWFENRVLADWKESFPLHLETILRGIISARLTGTIIDSLEIHGFYANLNKDSDILLHLATDAFANIRNLVLSDSFSLLSFLSDTPLPSLQRFELARCWIVGSDLDTFLQNHDSAGDKMYLRDIKLARGYFPEPAEYAGSELVSQGIIL